MYFSFCFCFFAWYSYRNYKFYNRIKICATAARIKKYTSITKKNKIKRDKTVFLAKPKLNSIEVVISKALTD